MSDSQDKEHDLDGLTMNGTLAAFSEKENADNTSSDGEFKNDSDDTDSDLPECVQ